VRRLVVLAAAVTLVVAVASADAASPGFRYGVAAGEITTKSAVLWTRAPRTGVVVLVFGVAGTNFATGGSQVARDP
jgi:phosphodiesterase/alkaline phosphatase D-like protein